MVGIIQKLPYDGEERLLYESRFSLFEKIQLPKYVPYETYKEQIEAENGSPNAFDQLLTEAKTYLTGASQRFKKLASLPEEARNERLTPVALLEKLQRIAIKSSL